MKDLDSRLRTLARAEETPLPEGFEARLGETLSALPERRRGGRPLRTAILAACVCLALAGTVLAVESGLFARVLRPGDPEFHNIQEDLPYELGYDVAGNWVVTTPAGAIPAEDFSPAVRDLAAEAVEQYAWTSAEDWQAAEDFVGRELPRFPQLAGQPGRTIYRSGEDGADEALGSCLVEVFTDGDGALTNVSVRECVEMTGEDQGLAVDVELLMATDAWGREEFRRDLTLSPRLLEVMEQSDYPTAWGGTAVILQAGDTACEAVVDWHGSMVSLAVSGGSGARTLLQALLDGME